MKTKEDAIRELKELIRQIEVLSADEWFEFQTLSQTFTHEDLNEPLTKLMTLH